MRFGLCFLLLTLSLWAENTVKVVDIPTRSGVSERILALTPPVVKVAMVVLFAGGHGGIQLSSDLILSH